MNKIKALGLSIVLSVFTSSALYAFENITPYEAYTMASNDAETYIIDVRTDAEWRWVGHPGADKLGNGAELDGKVINVSYKIFHGDNFVINPRFLNDIKFIFKKNKNIKLITMCRSGVRSVAAAKALEAAGYNAYNMETGFEGVKDVYGYRTVNGWKNDGQPYVASGSDEYGNSRND